MKGTHFQFPTYIQCSLYFNLLCSLLIYINTLWLNAKQLRVFLELPVVKQIYLVLKLELYYLPWSSSTLKVEILVLLNTIPPKLLQWLTFIATYILYKIYDFLINFLEVQSFCPTYRKVLLPVFEYFGTQVLFSQRLSKPVVVTLI